MYVCMWHIYINIYIYIYMYWLHTTYHLGENDDDKDIFFNGYGRYVDAEVGTIEITAGNREFGSNIDMYVVVIVPLSKSPFCLNLLSQIFLDTFPLDVTGTLSSILSV